jgi:hypothetical protein
VALNLPKKGQPKSIPPPALDTTSLDKKSNIDIIKQQNDLIPPQSLDEKVAEEIMNQANRDRPRDVSTQSEDKKLIEEQQKQLMLLQEQLKQQQEIQQQQLLLQQLQQQQLLLQQQTVTSATSNDNKAENTKPAIEKEPEKVLSCEDGNDPWVGIPVDSFKPPKGSSAVDARKWRQSVDKMMVDLKSQKIGGAPLRAYITEEVNKLELLRLELFCSYLAPKTASA